MKTVMLSDANTMDKGHVDTSHRSTICFTCSDPRTVFVLYIKFAAVRMQLMSQTLTVVVSYS